MGPCCGGEPRFSLSKINEGLRLLAPSPRVDAIGGVRATSTLTTVMVASLFRAVPKDLRTEGEAAVSQSAQGMGCSAGGRQRPITALAGLAERKFAVAWGPARRRAFDGEGRITKAERTGLAPRDIIRAPPRRMVGDRLRRPIFPATGRGPSCAAGIACPAIRGTAQVYPDLHQSGDPRPKRFETIGSIWAMPLTISMPSSFADPGASPPAWRRHHPGKARQVLKPSFRIENYARTCRRKASASAGNVAAASLPNCEMAPV